MAVKSTWIHGVNDARLAELLAERHQTHTTAAKPANEAGTESGFIFMRPPCHDIDCPDLPPDLPPDKPPDPCRGQTWVWQPDLAVRFINPLLNNECPSPSDLTRVQQALGANLSRFRLSDPEVRVSCENAIVDILIWGVRVQPGSCSDLARNRARIPSDVADRGNFGLYINAGLIRRLAQEAFEAAPKRLSSSGIPSSDGPIHLTGLSVGFKSPNTIKTFITGYDERPWPDVSFTTTITDQLFNLRTCKSESKTDPNRFDEILAALFAAVSVAMAVYVPVLLPLPAFALFTDVNALLNQPDNPTEGGVGCRLFESLPDEIALPQTGGVQPPVVVNSMAASHIAPDGVALQPEKKKLIIPYNEPRVDDRGILASAFVTTEDRTPAVLVSGPHALSIDFNAQASFGIFSAQPDDFYGNLSYTWSGGPNVVISNANAARTRITFKRGNAQPGDRLDRTVSIQVTDVEGSTATASLTVSVIVLESGTSIPAVCKVKPWLPVCNPS